MRVSMRLTLQHAELDDRPAGRQDSVTTERGVVTGRPSSPRVHLYGRAFLLR
ncbi:hypothetical protein CONPUDRAFT_85299, partial [Coniophora puteana RWD-64-598 SS2]